MTFCNSCMPTITVKVKIPTDYNVKDASDPIVKETVAKHFPYDPKFEQLEKAGCKVFVSVSEDKPAQAPAPEPEQHATSKPADNLQK